MQASVSTASDAQIFQIVALVDAMPDRGAADALIAPLRPRLAKLRPPRPLTFNRLLFSPLDTLIVAAPAWRRGSLSVPRTALPPLSAALREVMGATPAIVDTEGRKGPVLQSRVTELAAGLWPQAALALDSMAAPLSWIDATGLPRTDYPAIAATVAALLSVAADINALVQRGGIPSELAIRTILGRTAPRGGPALSAVVVVLLARLSGAGQTITLGTEAAGSNPSKAIDTAVDHILDRLQARLDADTAIGPNIAQATADSSHIADLLRELELGAANRPERKRRMDRLRRGADIMCRTRFESVRQDELLAKLAALPREPGDDLIEALEASARDLRHLEIHGSDLGSEDRYEALLTECRDPIERAKGRLRPEDRIRLLEILLGPRKAMRHLQK